MPTEKENRNEREDASRANLRFEVVLLQVLHVVQGLIEMLVEQLPIFLDGDIFHAIHKRCK